MPTPAAILHFHFPLLQLHRPLPSLFPVSIPSIPSIPILPSSTSTSRAYATQPERRLSSSIHCNSHNDSHSHSDRGDEAFQKTLRLVECAMFASVSGLAYFLSNSLSIENYFGCFFPLPIVISSVRWGLSAGRKTMVTFFLLFTYLR